MKSRRGCRLGLSCYCPPHDHLREQGNERKLLRGESEGCQRACHLCFRTAVLHETHETAASQWICRAPARDVGKAKSYQSPARDVGKAKSYQLDILGACCLDGNYLPYLVY